MNPWADAYSLLEVLRAGLFLGGIGTPVRGRNLDGAFSRWHLQSGYDVNQAIDEAFFAVRWTIPDTEHTDAGIAGPSNSDYFRRAAADLPNGISRRVYSPFPVTSEHYCGGEYTDNAPCEVIAEFFSPLLVRGKLPHDLVC